MEYKNSSFKFSFDELIIMEKNDEKTKNKILLLISIGGLSWLVITIIAAFIRFDSQNLSFTLASGGIWFSIVLLAIIGIFCFVLVSKLFKIHKERKNLINKILILYFTTSGLLASMQLILSTLTLSNEDLWYNIDQSSFTLLGISTIFLSLFIIEVLYGGLFENKKNILYLKIILVITICFAIIIELESLKFYEINLIANIFFFLCAIPFVIVSLFTFLALTVASFKLRNKVEDPIKKKAFIFLALSGLSLSIAFIIRLVPNALGFVNLYIELASHMFFMIGYISLYYGFTLPMQK